MRNSAKCLNIVQPSLKNRSRSVMVDSIEQSESWLMGLVSVISL